MFPMRSVFSFHYLPFSRESPCDPHGSHTLVSHRGKRWACPGCGGVACSQPGSCFLRRLCHRGIRARLPFPPRVRPRDAFSFRPASAGNAGEAFVPAVPGVARKRALSRAAVPGPRSTRPRPAHERNRSHSRMGFVVPGSQAWRCGFHSSLDPARTTDRYPTRPVHFSSSPFVAALVVAEGKRSTAPEGSICACLSISAQTAPPKREVGCPAPWPE
jgi:hypothetical protein